MEQHERGSFAISFPKMERFVLGPNAKLQINLSKLLLGFVCFFFFLFVAFVGAKNINRVVLALCSV